jgi:hypothetical protein
LLNQLVCVDPFVLKDEVCHDRLGCCRGRC